MRLAELCPLRRQKQRFDAPLNSPGQRERQAEREQPDEQPVALEAVGETRDWPPRCR
jgi:hypothetical protein